jgi:hypothetical protein
MILSFRLLAEAWQTMLSSPDVASANISIQRLLVHIGSCVAGQLRKASSDLRLVSVKIIRSSTGSERWWRKVIS